ncbi:MAG: pseudouridine synthase [Methanomicrobiales archaeon HGW-Methanomicrobiales-3]|jgi:archaeosine synthase|nr:MAG: pseudouridine synthase [Methanomicrobiales archaeon HGW-Methanomicrobiales-3]
MTRFNIRKRDGLARTGTFEPDITPGIKLPAATDTGVLFPSLAHAFNTNIPLPAPKSLIALYPPAIGEQPVSIHPQRENTAVSGDCVMVAGWHTAFANPRNFVEWLIQLKEKTPVDTAWYAPAAALPATVAILCYSGFDLFDYKAVDLRSAQGIFCTPTGEFPKDALESGICTCPGCLANDLKEHNRHALRQEIALVARYIEQGQLRELVESRCRMVADQVAILRHLDRQYLVLEQANPVGRAGIMRANSAESMQRAEVRRFAERLLSRYLPPKNADVAVLLPCSARKPYSLSQSHRRFQLAVGGRAHELIVTSPLGLVPRELETVYPAMHYDVPVTGYWDAEECAYIADIMTRYFRRHPYRRIIAHLEGGALKVAQMAAAACGITLEYSCTEHPTGTAELNALDAALAGERKVKDDRLHGMISYQFGADVDTRGVTLRGHYPEIYYSKGKAQIFSIDTTTGLLRPTFDGWAMIPEGYRVHIDDFIPEGDVLIPGVTRADPEIRDGDEVLVVGSKAMATGKAALPATDMARSRRGVAVRVRKIKKL